MAIRDILVTVDASPAGTGRPRLALALAEKHKARVTAVYVMPTPLIAAAPIGQGPLPPSTAAWTPGPPGGQPPADPEQAEGAEAAFRSEAQASGIDVEWYLFEERDIASFVACANAADLTIIGQQSDAAGAAGYAPDEVVVAVGRPVLIVPYAGRFEAVGRRVLIAWDGSREAARALDDALPLIAGAEAATLLHVGARDSDLEASRPGLERIVHHLRRHSVTATAEDTPRGDIPISDLLLSRAADFGADLIVAGAYHHSRWREALLGGVSRQLLQHMTVPLLMAH